MRRRLDRWRKRYRSAPIGSSGFVRPQTSVVRAGLVAACTAMWIGACGGIDSSNGGVPDPKKWQIELGKRDLQGPLRPIRWGIANFAKRSVQIFALVPHCAYTTPEPYVEKVKRQKMARGLELTMLVRFPKTKKGGGCLFSESGVSRWVNLGREVRDIRLYDGAVSPPARRSLPVRPLIG